MTYLQPPRWPVEARYIAEIGWRSRKCNVADGVTKQSSYSTRMDLLTKHRLEHEGVTIGKCENRDTTPPRSDPGLTLWHLAQETRVHFGEKVHPSMR